MLEKIPSILGEALKGVRPGPEKLVGAARFGTAPETIAVDSPAFGHRAPMPADVSEDGRKLSPPLSWHNLPKGTASLVLIVEDADSPTPAPLVHAIAYNLPGQDGGLGEGDLRGGGTLAMGKNSFLKATYLPPDPSSGHGPHRYAFQIFALDTRPTLDAVPGRTAVVDAMTGHVLAKGLLIGTYERP